MVLFFIAFSTTPFSSELFFLGLFVSSLSTQLIFLVSLLLLLLSTTAFSYVRLLPLFWVRPFHALYLSHPPPSSFLEGLSSEQFAELGSVHLLSFSARACSLAFLSSVSPILAICRAVLIYFVLFSGLFLELSVFSDSVDFNYYEGSFFNIFLRDFSCIFYCASLLSGSVPSSRAALSSENACSSFLCRWHVTATLTGWFHPQW